MVPLQVQGLSLEYYEYYTGQQDHHQAIYDVYMDWNNWQHQLSCNNDRVYYFVDPSKVDFIPKLPEDAPDNRLKALFTET